MTTETNKASLLKSESKSLAKMFAALSHPVRIALLRLTWDEALSGDQLAKLMNLAPSTISHHLEQLIEVGLMSTQQEGRLKRHQPNQAALSKSLTHLIAGDQQLPQPQETYQERVLRIFLKDGQLIKIPAQKKKRHVILRELIKSFEVDKRHPEHEINATLRRWHEDISTLRRELIELGLLKRSKGIYWRVAEAE